MAQGDSEPTLQRLLERLKEAQERRVQGDYRPRVEYCLICDESNLRVRDEKTGEYPNLDCQHDHYEYIIEDGHDHGGISEWIHCIEYLQEQGLDADA